MTPERGMNLPLLWRQEKKYSLSGRLLEFPNPGKVVFFQGTPFHFEDGGRTLRAFTEEERQRFILTHSF